MAIINSVFMGRAKKSAGNATFRTVRGRTIASQKVAKRGTTSGKLSENQFAMACISRFASIYAYDISVSFDPTTYGSSRNAFFKVNYTALKKALKPLYTESLKQGADKIPTDSEILGAIETYATANPADIYRVKKHGLEAVYLQGAWNSQDNPEGAGSGTNKIRISATASPAEGGKVTGAGFYEEGQEATLTATANEGYYFVKWSDGVNTESRTIVVGSTSASYVAEFEKGGEELG